MEPIDYQRSFIHKGPDPAETASRMPLEARCRLYPHGRRDRPVTFCLCAVHKTEFVFAPKNIIKDPSCDFRCVFSETEIGAMYFRDATREGSMTAESFADKGICPPHFEKARSARPLASDAEIIEAKINNEPLLGQTEILGDDGERHALLEFPIKNICVKAAENKWHVETGPVLLPETGWRGESLMRSLSLAYVGFNNCFEGEEIAEFLALWPVPETRSADGTTVYEFWKRVTHRARTRLISLGPAGG